MEILATILGGFLAACTGWFLQSRLEASRISHSRNLLIAGMTDDLSTSVELYDRVIEDWQKSHTVWFNLIDELFESRHVYTNNRDWLTLIPDNELRKTVYQYYRKSAQHLLQLRNAQQRKYDIDRIYKTQLQDFRIRNPGIDIEEAKRVVTDAMSAESNELDNLERGMPELVAGLNRHKNQANVILSKLPNIS